jgi:hypothetical protein
METDTIQVGYLVEHCKPKKKYKFGLGVVLQKKEISYNFNKPRPIVVFSVYWNLTGKVHSHFLEELELR